MEEEHCSADKIIANMAAAATATSLQSFHLLVFRLLVLVFLRSSPSVSSSVTSADSVSVGGGDSSSPSSTSVPSALSRFQFYLRINTAQPNPNYQEAADFLISQAKSLSLQPQILEFVPGKPLVLLKWPGKDPSLPSILLNSHTDVVPSENHKWAHHPFSAQLDPSTANIYARGSQDMKCVGIQYLEAIRKLRDSGFQPLRDVYLSFVPDEEIGGHDGAEKFADSDVFKKMNVGIVLDEGLASPDAHYRVFYAERSPWWLAIKATGAPGHGAKLYDNSAMENLHKSIESIRRFRAAQFDLVKSGSRAEGEVISVNMVFLKAGTPSPTVSYKCRLLLIFYQFCSRCGLSAGKADIFNILICHMYLILNTFTCQGFVMNLQPSEAVAGFDIRVPPTADSLSLERRIAEEWAPISRNMTFEVIP